MAVDEGESTGRRLYATALAGGAQALQRVLTPGEVLNFSTAPPYAVVLGRADAVQVTVRGQPFDVMPFALEFRDLLFDELVFGFSIIFPFSSQ